MIDLLQKSVSCAFTGHRAEKLPWRTNENDPRCLSFCAALMHAVEAAYADGKRRYYCGMATGADTLFCEAVLALRNRYPDVVLEAAVPYAGQSRQWNNAQRLRYETLLAQCDTVTVLAQRYLPGCYMRRNRYMVDNASLLIAAYNGAPGGTQNTILYAVRSGVPIREIPLD